MRNMRFDRVFSRFKWERIDIIDTVGHYVNGGWVELMPMIDRTISAIPLMMTPEELEIYSNGESSAAGITLTTKETLYFTDITAEGQEQRQSYVLYHGYKYRIVGSNLFRGNVRTLNIYNGLRFIY